MFLSPRDSRPRTRRCSRSGWRPHVRSPGGLSRLHSYGALLDGDAPRADLRTRHGRNPARLRRARGLAAGQSEAELVQGGVRLRETLDHLKRVEVALQESESRHAFLLRLGDALRLLVDPMAIQAEASRLLGERLLTDRVYYAEIDGAQGHLRVEKKLFAPVSQVWPDNIAVHFNWVGPTFRLGRAVVVIEHPNLAVDSRRGSSCRRRG